MPTLCCRPRQMTELVTTMKTPIATMPVICAIRLPPPRRPTASVPQMPATRWAEMAPTTSSIFSRSEEHTSELQSLMRISYAVFCWKKKKNVSKQHHEDNTNQYYTYP